MDAQKTIYTAEDFRAAFQRIAVLMESNKSRLCALDGELGDGDLGLTMSKGFKAVNTALEEINSNDLGALLGAVSDTLADTVASTMGTLVAAGFSKAAECCIGQTGLDIAGMQRFAQCFCEGIMTLGKAKVGDKTILDAVVPAVEALRQAREEGRGLDNALHSARSAAGKGLRDTAAMQARHGRAARYLDRSVGHEDAGAAVGALIFEGFSPQDC